MAEFTSHWLKYTPEATYQRTDKTDKRAFVSFVSATIASATPNSSDDAATGANLEPLYSRFRCIYSRDDFDSIAMRAERSKINMAIHRAKYCGPTCNCSENGKVKR